MGMNLPPRPATWTGCATTGSQTNPALFGVVTVHCFACSQTVTDLNPVAAHGRMEDHYQRTHAALIRQLVS